MIDFPIDDVFYDYESIVDAAVLYSGRDLVLMMKITLLVLLLLFQ